MLQVIQDKVIMMKEKRTHRSKGQSRVLAILGSLVGPSAAVLLETGHIDIFAEQYLLNLWVVVALAIGGASLGIYAIVRGALVLGITNLVLNTSVVALYGFLAAFFGLGGSR